MQKKSIPVCFCWLVPVRTSSLSNFVPVPLLWKWRATQVSWKKWLLKTMRTLCDPNPFSWLVDRKGIRPVMKKCSEQTQTLHAGCSKVEPKNFHLAVDPLPGGAGQPNIISWRWSLPLPTNPVWWGLMHAISSYLGNRPTHKHTNRQDRLQYTAPQLASAHCEY